MRLPRKLTILGTTWRVRYDPRLMKRMGAVGVTYPTRMEIVIDSTSSEAYQKSTLFHEFLHALFSLTNVHGLSEKQEETVVRILEATLPVCLRVNRLL